MSKTTKVIIDKDDWYPVYIVPEADWGITCEVPVETVERWKRVFDEFNVVQAEMETEYQKAEKQAREGGDPCQST